MVSLTSHATQFPFPLQMLERLNDSPVISSVILLGIPTRQLPRRPKTAFFSLKMGGSFVGSRLAKRRKQGTKRWWCWPKVWDWEGDEVGLEDEILEFMRNSEKPGVFPTKKELTDAGRMDLVKAIRQKGGWLSLGYESEDENEDGKVLETNILRVTWYNDAEEEFKGRVLSYEASDSLEKDEILYSEVASVSTSASPSSSVSSDKPIGLAAEEEAGIEGILIRLEKERNLFFGIGVGKGYNTALDLDKGDDNNRHLATPTNADRAALRRNGSPIAQGSNKAIYDNLGGRLTINGSVSNFNSIENSPTPTCRNWSLQQAGSSGTEFEAAEICFMKNEMEHEKDVLEGKKVQETVSTIEALDGQVIIHNHIRTRLQHLEHELSSALKLLRAKGEEMVEKDSGNSGTDLRKLSDACEFQENEFMSAQDRLRSTRVKLAVLEGKMALAIIDSKKIVEEKQKRIDSAHRALQLLRTACIVWPNSGSEVLLAGSFDGWTTKRKMEKSDTGIFSASLKLYPGRYEIKFIVDGTWRIDPLRPIVHNNGHENNLLIIT